MIGVPEVMLSTPYEIPWVDPKERIVEMRRLYETHALVEAYEQTGGFSMAVSYIRGHITKKNPKSVPVYGDTVGIPLP